MQIVNTDGKLSIISPYFTDLYFPKSFENSGITFAERFAEREDDSEFFTSLNQAINRRSKNFKANHAAVITFTNGLHYFDYRIGQYSNVLNFQVILASDGDTTYGVFNYDDISGKNGVTGYSDGDNCRGKKDRIDKRDQEQLPNHSNVGIPGTFVNLLSNINCQGINKFFF